jgi:hypothetical protein
MKKILLPIILSFSLISNVFAESGVGSLPMPPMGNSSLNAPGSSILKGVGAYWAAKKTKKIVAGMGLLTIAGVGWGAYEVKAHPEKIEEYLESHPEYIPTVVAMVSKYEWGQSYLDQIGVGDIYWQLQQDLENSKEWQDASIEVNKQVIQYADTFKQKLDCSNPQVRNAIWNDFLSDNFENTPTGNVVQYLHVNKNDIYENKGGVAEFDVNTYKLLQIFLL